MQKTKVDKVKKDENKSVVTTVRMTPSDDKFIKENKLSLSKIFNGAIDELKEQLKKETRAWD